MKPRRISEAERDPDRLVVRRPIEVSVADKRMFACRAGRAIDGNKASPPFSDAGARRKRIARQYLRRFRNPGQPARRRQLFPSDRKLITRASSAVRRAGRCLDRTLLEHPGAYPEGRGYDIRVRRSKGRHARQPNPSPDTHRNLTRKGGSRACQSAMAMWAGAGTQQELEPCSPATGSTSRAG